MAATVVMVATVETPGGFMTTLLRVPTEQAMAGTEAMAVTPVPAVMVVSHPIYSCLVRPKKNIWSR